MAKEMIQFVLKGKMKSGKNNMMVNPITGAHYPNPKFRAWRDDAVAQIAVSIHARTPISTACKMIARYYPGDRVRRDAPGIIDALFHVFEKVGLVKDDALIKDIEFQTMDLDRANPRCEIGMEIGS